MKKTIIDCSGPAKLPKDLNWEVVEHQKGGKIALEDITLWLHDKQKGGYIKGEDLKKEIKNPLNVNALTYLLSHPKLIPTEWKDYHGIYFWGTIFRSPGGGRCVLYLCWRGGQWHWDASWIEDDWNRRGPSAVLVSSSKDLIPSSEPKLLVTKLGLEERVERIENWIKNFK